MGRPRIGVRTYVVLPDGLRATIDLLAHANRHSQSEQIRLMLEDWVKANTDTK